MSKRDWPQYLLLVMLALFSSSSWAATACKVDYTIKGDWGTGFSADVNIVNQGDPLNNWQVSWDMPNDQRITGLWGATHQQNGQQVTVNNPSWKPTVASNETVHFAFNGAYQDNNLKPSNVRLNGVLCTGQEPPKPPVVACHADYQITADWGSGFVANVVINNTGDDLSGWSLTWDMPNEEKINSLWNGSHQQTEQAVSVNNLSWNKKVISGQKIQLGFSGQYGAINQVPGNIALNGVTCEGQTPPEPVKNEVACEVDYHIRNQWNTGFVTDVTIKNTGDPLNHWDVTWSMPNQQHIDNLWNGTYTQTADKVSVSNVQWNNRVASDESLQFGFSATHNGLNPAPIDLALNGVRCDGQADSVEVPPAAPNQLTIQLIDNQNAELNWQDNSDNETQVLVQRRLEGANWSTVATLGSNTTHYTDTTLVIGQRYEYRVRASNDSGDSSASNSHFAKRQDRTDIDGLMLANSCASCHNTKGVSVGESIPSISGLNRDYFIRTMKAYQSGERASSMMDRIAKGYTEQQITRMADYFAGLDFVPAVKETDQALVNKGRTIHEGNCIICHSGTGEDDALTGTRLDGQWAIYLEATLEDYTAGRSSNIPSGMRNQLQTIKESYGDDALTALAEYYIASAQAKANRDPIDTGDGSGNGDSSDNSDNGDANNGDDSTDNSGEDGTDDQTGTVPTMPSSLASTLLDNAAVVLSWQDSSDNEQGFRVERRTQGDSTWQVQATLAANTTNYSDTSVIMGTDYDYQVLAYNTSGDSSAINTQAKVLSLLDYGKQQYQDQNCASCHGADGKGGFTGQALTGFSSEHLTSLTEINRSTMPPANPAACEGNCALAVAHYIIDTLATNNQGGDDNVQACSSASPPSKRSLRLLTRQEYQNTVNDLLGLSVSLVHQMPEENRVEGYDNNIADNLVTGTRLESYIQQAEQLATQAVQQSWDAIVPCDTQTTACAEQFVREFGKLAYRRPLSESEVTQQLQHFSGTVFNDAVENTLMSMLVSPHFLYRSELGELQPDGTYRLTPYETASSLSYLFLGSMPDAALFQAAANNQLATPQQRITQASRLLEDPRSRNQVGNFVGQWLLSSSPYTLPNKDVNVYPGYTDQVRSAMSQELINFFNHVAFDSSQNFNELFSANYIIANRALADFYQQAGPMGDTPEVTPVTDGTRTGIMTLGAVLARYANSAESHPFKRGAFLYQRLLCHDMPAAENAGVVAAPMPDPDVTTRERFRFHSESDASCYSCHQYLDDPGFSFENYDGSGQYRAQENGNAIVVGGTLRGLETYSADEENAFGDLQQLSALVANSDNAAQCVAKQYYRYTTGRIETDADNCALEHFIQTYADNGYNLQTMLLGIVNTPGFNLRRAD